MTGPYERSWIRTETRAGGLVLERHVGDKMRQVTEAKLHNSYEALMKPPRNKGAS